MDQTVLSAEDATQQQSSKKQPAKNQPSKKQLSTKQLQKDELVYVKKSKIHGMGLFAKCDIPEGQILGKVEGMRTNRDGPHVLWMEDHKYGFKVRCKLKYINHSAEPNACYYDDLTVVTLRDIKKDEEITHFYGEEWEE